MGGYGFNIISMEVLILEKFNPVFAISPGETVKECMDYLGLNTEQLSHELNISTEHMEEIFEGKEKITPDIAQGLNRVFSISKSFWLNLEDNYREDLKKV